MANPALERYYLPDTLEAQIPAARRQYEDFVYETSKRSLPLGAFMAFGASPMYQGVKQAARMPSLPMPARTIAQLLEYAVAGDEPGVRSTGNADPFGQMRAAYSGYSRALGENPTYLKLLDLFGP